MKIIPSSKPQWPRERIEKVSADAKVSETVALVGVRGYYQDSMGAKGRNDRGIYDDAMFLISEHTFASFNCNVDPSKFRKGIANLKAGLWWYKIGIHGLSKPANRRYKALVQAAKVTVVRDGTGDDTGYFGINIHRGGASSTSSLGCQTIYPTQWPAFIALVESEMKRAGQTKIPYLLIEEQG